MGFPATVENQIVGGGPAAVAAAMALRRLGKRFEVIDAGYDLEPARESAVARLAARDPAEWADEDVRLLFPPPVASAKGVEKRFAFGSSFPYRASPFLEIDARDCIIDVSHGVGGFGNVWGAAALPYADPDLDDWPIEAGELARSYREVLRYVPLSGEADELERIFPRHAADTGRLVLSEQVAMLKAALDRRGESLKRKGIHVGRARVAVDSQGGERTCRYCGRCLEGCVYGSIFNPRNLWKRLREEGVALVQGKHALEFEERADAVDLVVADLASGRRERIRAQRVFIGAGALNSTRIVARSLGWSGRPIRLADSQYFFFPLLSYRRAPRPPSFTLAELFIEISRPDLSRYFTHFQVYGLNDIFRRTLRALLPSFLRRRALLEQLESRFYLFQGFLHSEHSGRLELTLESATDALDRVTIRGVPNPDALRVARRAQRLLRRELIGFGVVPPVYLNMVPIGRSFHIGGSFPMGGADPDFRSDLLGRPAGLRRVHLIDASIFPTLPATTITLSIMASADRVVSAAMGE